MSAVGIDRGPTEYSTGPSSKRGKQLWHRYPIQSDIPAIHEQGAAGTDNTFEACKRRSVAVFAAIVDSTIDYALQIFVELGFTAESTIDDAPQVFTKPGSTGDSTIDCSHEFEKKAGAQAILVPPVQEQRISCISADATRTA